MPSFKIDIRPDAYNKLMEMAVSEKRPIAWQAEVLLEWAIWYASALQQPAHATSNVPLPIDGEASL